MPKISFVEAGSLVFTRNLCNDILHYSHSPTAPSR